MSGNYWIDRGAGAVAASLNEWSRWLEEDPAISGRRVASTVVAGIHVSTVCLGMDHSFGAPGSPILYETMTFASDTPAEHERCAIAHCVGRRLLDDLCADHLALRAVGFPFVDIDRRSSRTIAFREWCERYQTRAQALEGHTRVAAWVLAGMKGEGP